MTVVYCPRTHAWFDHPRWPLEKMLSLGVAVALGTDSRASSPDLSLLAELRTLAARHPAVEPRVVLQLGTSRAAAALGYGHEAGTLEAGKFANLAVVALPDRDAADPHEVVVRLGPAGGCVTTRRRVYWATVATRSLLFT